MRGFRFSGQTGVFNAVNGLLLDVLMRVPLLFGGNWDALAVLMLGSVLMVQLRALYARASRRRLSPVKVDPRRCG